MQVRALVLTYCNGIRNPGDLFDYDGPLGEGLEEVTPKTTKNAKARADAELKEAKDKAVALRAAADEANAKLQATPGDSELAAAAITADDVARNAERALDAAVDSDMV